MSLTIASREGHFEIVKYLVEEAGANTEAETTVSIKVKVGIKVL